MYGSADTDPAVKYYDTAFAAGATSDVSWFSTQAAEEGSPVLDLACGTGRIALEMARTGLEVVALDNSDGMLDLFKRKILLEPRSVQDRIKVDRQPMDQFCLATTFRSIICCDAFFHNLTPGAERQCLTLVNRHLPVGGVFLFNIHNNPNPDFLSWASSAGAAEAHKRGEYPLPGKAGNLTVYETLLHDAANQRVDTKLRFTVTRADGSLGEDSESTWSSRYLCRYEAVYLTELCGFTLEGLWGGYHEEEVTVASQLVFKIRKSKQI